MTTQVPAQSAITFGQASHSSVRKIGPSISAFFAGAGGGGSGRSSSSTGISATPISGISAPGRMTRQSVRGLAIRSCAISLSAIGRASRLPSRGCPSTGGPIPRARGAMGACGIAGGPGGPGSPTRPTRPTAACRRGGLQMHGNMPAAAGGKTFKQALQHFGAGRVIVADICHQLPALLPDLERTSGLADLGDIVLRIEQHAQERANSFAPPRLTPKRSRDLVEILHADQLAGEMQQIAGILRAEQLHHHGCCGLHIFHRVVAIGFFQPRLWPARDRQGRRCGWIEQRRFEMPREHQPLIELERIIVLQ